MIIKYKKRDGSPVEFKLTETSITLGRSPDADIIVLDERSSRMHASIRFWEGAHYIKDLQSKNGTWLNGERVEMHKIHSGDTIRLGTSQFHVEGTGAAVGKVVAAVAGRIGGSDSVNDELNEGKGMAGTRNVNRHIEEEYEEGKGLGTIMREIVSEVEQVEQARSADPEPSVEPEITAEVEEPAAAPPKPTKPSLRPKPKLNLGAKKAAAEKEAAAAVDAEDVPDPSPQTIQVKPKLGAKKPVVEAVENEFSEAEDLGKNTTMPIQDIEDEASTKGSLPKPKLKLGKKSDDDGKPKLKRPGTLRLKKPDS